MISFRSPKISDKGWVRELLSYSDSYGCGYTFGNIMIWGPEYHTKIGRYGNLFILYEPSGDAYFKCSFPRGQGDIRPAVNSLINLAGERGEKLFLISLTENDVQQLKTAYGNAFTVSENRNGFDYIYKQSELEALQGKRYHSKRNHIAYFEKNYDWNYEEITDSNMEECYEMCKSWAIGKAEELDESLEKELRCVTRSFDLFHELDFKGGLIRANGNIAAFTIGEELDKLTFDVHIEKAYREIRGAYPLINREFVKRLSAYKYINREDDEGSEGLRKAKMSYHPILLKNYVAIYHG